VVDQGQTFARPNNHVTINGDNSGNIASGNHDVTQWAVTHSQLPTRDIAEIMQVIIEAAGAWQLPDRDRDELVRTAESAKYELDAAEPDEGQIKQLSGKVIRLLGHTVNAVLPVVLTKYLELKLGIGSAT
jgi:hypothetical protein